MSTIWNTYAFYVLYADIDRFDPTKHTLKRENLSLMDRWILSRLQTLTKTVDSNLEAFRITEAGRALIDFADELSNWYVRRCRDRYWGAEMTDDKEAAYMTLYTVLRTVTLLTAPFCPFMTEAIYQNIVRSVDETAPISVHLNDYPAADESFVDEALEDEMAKILNIVTVGRSARSSAGQKTRQPLQKMYVQGSALSERAAEIVTEELNVKEIEFIDNADALMSYKVKPQLRTLGPRYGKLLGKISAHLAENGDAIVRAHHAGGDYTFEIDGTEVLLSKDDVLVSTQQKEGLVSEQGSGVTVVLDTNLTPALKEEGLMRELVSKLQTMRKEAGFEVADHIRIGYENGGEAASVLLKYAENVMADTLAEHIEEGVFGYTKDWDLNGNAITLSVERI